MKVSFQGDVHSVEGRGFIVPKHNSIRIPLLSFQADVHSVLHSPRAMENILFCLTQTLPALFTEGIALTATTCHVHLRTHRFLFVVVVVVVGGGGGGLFLLFLLLLLFFLFLLFFFLRLIPFSFPSSSMASPFELPTWLFMLNACFWPPSSKWRIKFVFFCTWSMAIASGDWSASARLHELPGQASSANEDVNDRIRKKTIPENQQSIFTNKWMIDHC